MTTNNLLPELERLAREATKPHARRAVADYHYALIDAAPLLLAAVRAAEACLPYMPDMDPKLGAAKYSAHLKACMALRDALKALKGET